jgi:secondary thiamine-phosphate synthase enzyme
MKLQEATIKTCVFSLPVKSSSAPEFIDITDEVIELVKQSRVLNGFVVVFSRHTTAAIVIQENEPLLLDDLAKMLERCAPRDGYYKHNDFSIRTVNMRDNEPPNGHAHCQHITLGSSETIPIIDGKPALGNYQRVFLVELDALTPEPYREVLVQVLGV